MSKVIALEGTWPSDAVVAWGAAALQSGEAGAVRNTVSRALQDEASWKQLVDEGHAWKLPEPITIRPEYEENRLVLVGIRTDSTNHDFLLADTGKLGGLIAQKRSKPYLFYVFSDREAFDEYATDTAASITWYALKQPADKPELSDLIAAGLILAPTDPQLHALRVTLASNRGRATAVSRAALAGSPALPAFERLLQALTADAHVDYWLKYQDGIAEGGGLDVDVAAVQLGALAFVHKRLVPVLQERYPFLQSETSVPSFRFRNLEAASAKLGFGVSLEGRPLLDRVARYLEIDLLQEVLRGHVPEPLVNDREFQEHLERLCRPSPDTTVRQRPLQTDEDEAVVYEPFSRSHARHDANVTALAYVQGAYKRLRRAELRLSSSISEVVSTENNGFDRPPVGADVFQQAAGSYFFRPSVVKLDRFADDQGRYRWYLSSIAILKIDQTASISAVPSAILPGALFQHAALSVKRVSESDYELPGLTLRLENPLTLSTAEKWMSDFFGYAAQYELKHGLDPDVSWVRPLKLKPASALMRVLLVLQKRGGTALLPDLISDVNALAESRVRRNNTRREIRNAPELAVFDPEDDELVHITAVGSQHALIYMRAVPEIVSKLEE